MASRSSRPRGLLLPIVLAGVLAAEVTGLALARSIVPSPAVSTSQARPVPPSGLAVGRLRDELARTARNAGHGAVPDLGRDPRTRLSTNVGRRPLPAAEPGARPPGSVRPDRTTTGGGSTGRGGGSGKAPVATRQYHGRNHVWIPSLGINRSVGSFSCTRSRAPDNYLYRWGCAGRNNVYLLGHAWGVFKPLHDAYVRGRLHKGMKVMYADGGGDVHTYSVTWWRLVAPTAAASWVWAAQTRPSMTLQTCVGSRSQYRLMVRLVRTD